MLSPKPTLVHQQHIYQTDWLFQSGQRYCLISSEVTRRGGYLVLLPLSHSTQRCLLHQPAQYQPVSAHFLKKSKSSSSSPHKTDKQGQLVNGNTAAHSTLAQVWHYNRCCVVSVYSAQSVSQSTTSGFTLLQHSE